MIAVEMIAVEAIPVGVIAVEMIAVEVITSIDNRCCGNHLNQQSLLR